MIPPEELQAGKYFKSGIDTQKNIPGKYRECWENLCEVWVACPYTTCQKHRKDYCKEDNVVKEWTG